MDTNKEYLQTPYAPGRNFEALAVAFAMNYMREHPGTLSLCKMADALRVTPECLNDLVIRAGESRLLSGQRPDRLEQLADVNASRYANFLQFVGQNDRVADPANPSLSVDAGELALARFYLNTHDNSRYRTTVARALGIDGRALQGLLAAATGKAIFRNENAALLAKYADEHIDDYNRFLGKLDDALYVKSSIEPGRKLEDLIVGFAVNYIHKHPDADTKARVFAMLKVSPEVLGELYRKAQQRPVLKGYVVETLGKLAQANWKRYKTFVDRVQATDLRIAVDAGDLIERMIPSREVAAAVHLINMKELSADQICQVWGLSRDGFDNVVNKYTNSEQFLTGYVDHPENREAFVAGISREIEGLRDAAAELLNPQYKVSGEQGLVNINTVNDEDRMRYLAYHPDVFAGLDKEHTNYEAAMTACKANGLALEHVVAKAPRLVDYRLCMAAVESNGYALKWVKRAWRDRKMCYAAVSNDPQAYRFVPRNMKSERKLMHLAITPKSGGDNIRFAFKKDMSRYLCNTSAKTFAEARDFFPERFAPSDNELKRREKAARLQAAGQQEQQKAEGVKATPQDYFDMYPELVKEAREAIMNNFSAVKPEAERYVQDVAAFYKNELSASEFLDRSLKGRFPEDFDPVAKYRIAVINSYNCAERHPGMLPGDRLNINFTPAVQRDFSAIGPEHFMDSRTAAGSADNLMEGPYVKPLVYLARQEAELSVAYRNGEISADKYLSTLPVGSQVPPGTEKEIRELADERSGYWASQFPEMIRSEKQDQQLRQSEDQAENRGPRMHR